VPGWLVAPSLADPAPLAGFLDRALDARLMDAIAAGHADGRRLLIAATNIDSGAGDIFDLGEAAVAGDGAPCLRDAILASAAIPALFPPRNINGALFADGGLRQQVFLDAIDDARGAVTRDMGVDVRVEAYLVVNGALRAPDTPVGDRLIDYTLRSLDTLADEVLRDSITEAVTFAESRPGWRLRGIRADLPRDTCATGGGAEIGGFDPCLTAALFDHGRAEGQRTPINWLSEAELRALADEL
ncbi:MAG: patatin-like phospholipase family protein, partial [Jannaschia sp.]